MSRAPAQFAVLVALGLAGCGEREAEAPANNAVAVAPVADVFGKRENSATAGWVYLSSGEGVALRLDWGDGIHLFCPAGEERLLVNVPAFKPIGSEERLSFGSNGIPVALVADSRGDALRGGVTGEGPVPVDLAGILEGVIAASYGAQSVGPLPSPSAADRRAFVAACAEKAPPAPAPPIPAPPKPAPQAAACSVQDGVKLTFAPLRAIGTEPFWGARIEGRCVTYSTPEDQAGTRVWTKFTPGPGGGVWSGSLGGRQFELRTTRAAPPGCSDGMSDNRYPHQVTLRVSGETRRGCAKPL